MVYNTTYRTSQGVPVKGAKSGLAVAKVIKICKTTQNTSEGILAGKKTGLPANKVIKVYNVRIRYSRERKNQEVLSPK